MNPRAKMRGYGSAAIAVLAATVGWLLVQQPIQADKTDAAQSTAQQAKNEVAEVKVQVDANGRALEEANRRLKAAGRPPVPVPSTPPPAPVQPDEFTAEEAFAVRQIVTDLLSTQKVTITQAEISQIARTAAALVPKPKDGTSPTAAQIRPAVVAAVAAYCVGDKCVGPAGKEGPRGDKGDPAPKVTDEELLASAKLALGAYCGLESQPCKGEPGATVTGPPGAAGKQGEVGRGILGTTCQQDGRWLFRYSDGSTETVEGPCRIGAVENEPTN